MRSVNPASGELLAEYPPHSPAEIERRLAAARDAQRAWGGRSPAERAALLVAVAARLRQDRDAHARLMTLEMGKPIAQAESEVEKCAWVCEHYAAHGAGYLAPERIATDASSSFVAYEPLGVVLAVMPWNFPFWQVLRCAAPALCAGNAVALKHSSNVTGCALAIERAFLAAGAPEGLLGVLLVAGTEAGPLLSHPAIAAASVTGSEAAGAAVAAAAGRAIKPSVLELGGSDAFVVLRDADPEAVAAEAVGARVINNGQSCIAAKRFIVEAPLAGRFTLALAAGMEALRVGDPLARDTQVGPLARADLRDELHAQVERTLAAGARLVCGGRAIPGPGWFYAPTVLGDVEPGMAVFDEETFGPVAPVIVARDEAHAVELTNRSRFGLGASVWTPDRARGLSVAARIEAGAVFVNGTVKSDPRLPFGGVKLSGYGRELGREGIRAFVNVKTVWAR